MEKAFSVGLRETRDKLVKVLNESGLPIDVMDMMLGELKNTVHAQAEAEYQMELAKAEQAAKAEKGGDTKKT